MAIGPSPSAFNLTPSPPGALSAEYEAIVGRDGGTLRLGPKAAMDIEDAIGQVGWPIDRVCGPEAALARNFGVSIRVVRQAFRILEARGACRIRRGPAGGLIVTAPDQATAAVAMATHLRWTGVDQDEVWEARELIEPLVAASAAKAIARGHKSGDAGRASLLASPFLSLGLACLDQFAGASEAVFDSGDLGAAIQAGCESQAFDLAVGSVRLRRREPLSVAPSVLTPPFKGDPGDSLAALVATRITQAMNPEACRSGERLGAAGALAERYGVSLVTVIEAVRLLEDAGLVQSLKGRGGGVRLRQPDPLPVVGTVHGHLAARGAAPEADLCLRLNRWAAETAAQRRSPAQARSLARAWRLASPEAEPEVMRAWYDLQRRLYDIAGNRPLHLLAVCLAGFTVRSARPPPRPVDPKFVSAIRAAGTVIVTGVQKGDVRLAGLGQEQARDLLAPSERPGTSEAATPIVGSI